MAIDFSKVKTITIPEGSVKQITDSQGNILWKKAAQWHTVWEGNQKIGYGGWVGNQYLFATEPYSDALKIRISFSDLSGEITSGDEGYCHYIPSNKNSPVTYDKSNLVVNLIEANAGNTTRNAYYSSSLYYTKQNGKIYGTTYSRNAEGNVWSYIVITKIEVYS